MGGEEAEAGGGGALSGGGWAAEHSCRPRATPAHTSHAVPTCSSPAPGRPLSRRTHQGDPDERHPGVAAQRLAPPRLHIWPVEQRLPQRRCLLLAGSRPARRRGGRGGAAGRREGGAEARRSGRDEPRPAAQRWRHPQTSSNRLSTAAAVAAQQRQPQAALTCSARRPALPAPRPPLPGRRPAGTGAPTGSAPAPPGRRLVCGGRGEGWVVAEGSSSRVSSARVSRARDRAGCTTAVPAQAPGAPASLYRPTL